MRILFLDDRGERLDVAAARYREHGPFLVRTVKEAIMLLGEGSWDLVCLDHDLGGESFVDSDREDCGMEVVRWIETHLPDIGKITIHSSNPEAAHEMFWRLRAAGYSVVRERFSYE